MAVSRRISYFRQKHNLTQKQLGLLLGFSESTAEVRVNQYEHGNRKPKEAMLEKLGEIFGVDPAVFRIPDIHNRAGLMQTFFALEDYAGWKLTKVDGRFAVVIGTATAGPQKTFDDYVLQEWLDMQTALEQGEITRREYDEWRYHYNDASLEKHLMATYKQLEELQEEE